MHGYLWFDLKQVVDHFQVLLLNLKSLLFALAPVQSSGSHARRRRVTRAAVRALRAAGPTAALDALDALEGEAAAGARPVVQRRVDSLRLVGSLL